MRPRNMMLRRRYMIAAEELRESGQSVTSRTLSAHLCKPYHAVRTFFDRNRDLADQIGLETRRHHSKKDYREARERVVERGVKPTARAVASELGVSHSSVIRHFKQRRINENAPRNDAPTQPEKTVRSRDQPTWLTSVVRMGELTVQHFDPRVNRVVLNKVSPGTYVQLWDAGHLHFQIKGDPKPEYLPTREEISEFT